MKKKVLIFSVDSHNLVQMAQGWLKHMDRNLTVESAYEGKHKPVLPSVVDIMKETNVDISKQNAVPVNDFLNDEWDFIIDINNDPASTYPPFTHKSAYRVSMNIEDVTTNIEVTHNELENLRKAVYNDVFDFYTKDVLGKESFGSDGCAS